MGATKLIYLCRNWLKMGAGIMCEGEGAYGQDSKVVVYVHRQIHT